MDGAEPGFAILMRGVFFVVFAAAAVGKVIDPYGAVADLQFRGVPPVAAVSVIVVVAGAEAGVAVFVAAPGARKLLALVSATLVILIASTWLAIRRASDGGTADCRCLPVSRATIDQALIRNSCLVAGGLAAALAVVRGRGAAQSMDP